MLNAWLLRGRPERKVVNYTYCYSHLFARSSFLRIALSREYMNVVGVNFTEITTDLLNIFLCGNTLCLVKSSKKKRQVILAWEIGETENLRALPKKLRS